MVTTDAHVSRASRHLSRRLIASLALLVGLLNIASVFTPGLVSRLEFLSDVLPVVGVAAPGVSVALGVLLLGLAQGLGRGKRRAWRIAVGLLTTQVVLQAVLDHLLVMVASLMLLGLLVATRRQFVGRPDPSTRRHATIAGVGLLSLSIVTGWLSLTLVDHRTGRLVSAGGRLVATLQGLVGIPSVVTSPDGRILDALYYLLLSLGLLTVAVTGYLMLRSSAYAPARTAEDELALRGLITRFGSQDSLAYFATRADRAVVWSANRRACISYRVVAGAALAAGDPLGPRSEWPDAIAAFTTIAREHAWVPAVVAAGPEGAEMWERWGGLTALEFGDEAVLLPAHFTLEGREMRNVRQAVARAHRAGYVVTTSRLADLDATRLELVRDRADGWRAGGVERGFSMGLGRLDASLDPMSVVVTADIDGEPEAVLVFVPWGGAGLSLDLMRRSPHSVSGVNELMISTLMDRSVELGVERVSLNFAVFRDAIERAERIGAGPLTRLWGRLLKTLSAWSQADSLYRFTAKFHPVWQPRYLVYATTVGLPRVAVAYLDAESFLRLPLLRHRRGTVAPLTPAPIKLGELRDAGHAAGPLPGASP